jgi:lysophospholipase L1-like esterase
MAVLLVVMAAAPWMIAQTAQEHWVGTWATAPYAHGAWEMPDFANRTLRQIVHTSLAGQRIRIRFTNEFGIGPLEIEAAHVALALGEGPGVVPGTDHGVTFDGRPSMSIPAGAMALSDPIDLPVDAFANLAISIYLPAQQISVASYHDGANQTNYLQTGNETGATTLESPRKITSWYFLKGVDVETTAAGAAAVVAFGDSITDGAYATLDQNVRWSDDLARRLHSNAKTSNLAVLNEGIGGNRVLHDGTGPSALSRFDRDVLAQAGVRYVIVLEGINDIGRLARHNDPEDVVSAEDLEQGLQQLVARAHEHNIKVFGATLTPYQGAGYETETGEAIRAAINQWIRLSGVFDGVVDFDQATQDPAHPLMFLPKYDSGDHLHPNPAGYAAMGDSVDLGLFQ